MIKQDMVVNNDSYAMAAGLGSLIVLGGWVLVGVLAALVAMALTPPKTRLEVFGMVAAAFGMSLFVGPLVIEAYHMTHYSFQSKLGVCFMCGAPAWLLWSIGRTILQRWRDSKNPVSTIAADVEKIKRLL